MVWVVISGGARRLVFLLSRFAGERVDLAGEVERIVSGRVLLVSSLRGGRGCPLIEWLT